MAVIRHHKYVGALPSPLEADSVYYVRAGTGFDIYVTNSSGMVVAYPLNQAGGDGGEDRLLAIYNGQVGGSAIEQSGQGVAFHADAQALFPALTTTVATAPRDPVFVPTNWPAAEIPQGTPVAASGTAAGVQLVAGAGGSVQLTTGSTANGFALTRFFQDALLTVPMDKVTAVRMTADVSIQTLSVAAQRFGVAVSAFLLGVFALEVTYTDTTNGGAFTLNWSFSKSEAESDEGSVSTGVVPTAGVTYTIDFDAAFSASGGSVVVRIVNRTTSAVTTITVPTPPVVYETSAPAFWEVSLFKSTGTTARTVRLNRARGYVRHA
ncbi:hypothetical protein DFO61_3369 [Ectopseudomonas oleovorans]|uniref:Uncharacterized protein n=1 Tax=Ectopseudomonas oleovorans TaxID=301 RepID=A0A397MG67_ECTOL|nr:hypothetical protein [Pseudomonas oleovorans]RIA22679.1 hypothetical protein DFO61_3369 [Pseudomonas oleovorans]